MGGKSTISGRGLAWVPNAPGFLGVDPGKNGAMCFLYEASVGIAEEPGYLWVFDNFSESELVSIFRTIQPFVIAALMEDVRIHKGSKGHKQSAFTQGFHSGLVTGIMWALEIPFMETSAQRWKEHTGLAKRMRAADKSPGKETAKTVADDEARRRYPYLKRNIIHSSGDAVLIAEVARKLGTRHGEEDEADAS